MKQKVLFYGGLLIGAAIIVALLHKIDIEELRIQIQAVDGYQWLAINIIFLIIFLFLVFKAKIIFVEFKERISFFHLFQARLMEYAISYITPFSYGGGEPLRILFLKKKGISVKKSVAGVILERLSELVAIIVSLFFVFAIMIYEEENAIAYILLTIIAILFFFFFLFYNPTKIKPFFDFIARSALFFGLAISFDSLFKNIGIIENDVNHFVKKKKFVFAICCCLSFVQTMFWISLGPMILDFLGEEVRFTDFFLIRMSMVVASFVPIPMALGSFEWATVAASQSLNITQEAAFTTAGILRALDLLYTTAGLLLIMRHGLKFSFTAGETDDENAKFKNQNISDISSFVRHR
ncbi:MAG: flippase-like domain-containing protein [Parcubacteria group bacterium]|nr:flippase-like domain-containing protein [Parcubacteria group bacterium]